MIVKKNPERFWQYSNKKEENINKYRGLKMARHEWGKKLAQNDRDKAVALQEFFSSVFTREPDNDFEKLPCRVNDQSKQMSDFNICQEKIEGKLQQLNTAKSPGPDCLHHRFYIKLVQS